MKKIAAIALGLGLAFTSASFAQDKATKAPAKKGTKAPKATKAKPTKAPKSTKK